MAGKPKKKEAEFSLIEYNKGFKPRILKEGDRVKIYKIPYKAKWETGSGVIVRIISVGNFSTYCDVRNDRTGRIESQHIYTGKIVQE